MTEIIISIEGLRLTATLFDTLTGKAISEALPFEGQAQVWGDEIYFSIPVNVSEEADAMEEVEVGALALWPPGNAFCIFFGKTPASTSDKPRAASPVNVFGKIEGDTEALKNVGYGTLVRVEKG